MPAYDYSAVADLYDAFCVFDGDIRFFQQATAGVDGAVLELMAGTGRVSVPMLEEGAAVVCVDRCLAMLAVLGDKLRGRDLDARLLCSDVCRLPFEGEFELAVLPFQGFTELAGEDEQRSALRAVARSLRGGGRFVCTSHSPQARRATVDGRWREVGRFTGGGGETLVLTLRVDHGDHPGLVVGTQKIEVLDRSDRVVEERSVDLEFSLTSADDIVEMARASGLEVVGVYGDYSWSLYDEKTSPCVIAVFEKPAE